MKDKFTICVLLYGDYPHLADRCLRSITQAVAAEDLNLRVGLNEVSDRVTEWVRSWVAPECIWESPTNLHKYPMMRDMLYGIRPVDTEYFMWFDDDSYIDESYSLLVANDKPYWLRQVDHAMVNSDVIGSVYTIGWQGKQREYVKAQSWYNGRDPAERTKIRFATGGWWTARTALLEEQNYPWPDLDHRGGDAMLGEMCFQHGLRLNQFREGLHINSNTAGQESKASRRGFDQPPLGVKYDPGVAATLHRATAVPPVAPPKLGRSPKPIIEL